MARSVCLSDLRKMNMDVPGIAGFEDSSAKLTPEQLTQVATSTSLNLDILSKSGGFSQVRHIGVPGRWTVDVTKLNAHVRAWGELRSDQIAVLTVQQQSESTICRASMDDASILVMPPGTEIVASIVPGLRYTTVLVPNETWLEIAGKTTGDAFGLNPSSPKAFKLDAGRLAQITQALAAFAVMPWRQQQSNRDIPAGLFDYLGLIAEAQMDAEKGECRLDTNPSNRIRQAWTAAEYIVENIENDISIVSLCGLVNASRRQLEYAFRSVFDVGPSQFIRLTRLNESRRRLAGGRDLGVSVTDIAMELGMCHLGHFAAGYRMLFGERPKDTYSRGNIC